MIASYRSSEDLRVPAPSDAPDPHLGQLHLQDVAGLDAGVEAGHLLDGGLDLDDDLDVGEDDDGGGQDQAEEEDGQDEGLAGQRGLGQPPVQRAGGPEGFRGVAPPPQQGHGGPEGRVEPHCRQDQEGVLALQPRA